MTDGELSALAARALAAAGDGAQARVLHERRVRPGELRERTVVELAFARDGLVGWARTTDVSDAGLAAAAAAATAASSGDQRSGFPGWPAPAAGRPHEGWDPVAARLEPGALPGGVAEAGEPGRDRLLDGDRRDRAPLTRGGRRGRAGLAGAADLGRCGTPRRPRHALGRAGRRRRGLDRARRPPGRRRRGAAAAYLVLVGGADGEAELIAAVDDGLYVSAPLRLGRFPSNARSAATRRSSPLTPPACGGVASASRKQRDMGPRLHRRVAAA